MSRKKRGRVSKSKKKVEKEPLPEVKNKEFWAVIGIIFLLSAMTILIMQENSNLTGGIATQTIALQKAGTELAFEIKNTDGLNNAVVTFKDDVKNAKISFEEVDKVSWDFDGRIFSMFTIGSTDAGKIEKIELNLKLDENDIKDKLLQRGWITVYYNGEAIPTTLTKFENGKAFYSITISRMGEYLIGFKAEPVVEQTIEKEVEPIEEPEQVMEKEVEPIMEKEEVKEPEQQQVPVEKGFLAKVGDWFSNLFD